MGVNESFRIKRDDGAKGQVCVLTQATQSFACQLLQNLIKQCNAYTVKPHQRQHGW